MIVTLIVAVRKSEPETPEVMGAWDEYSIDENRSGFEEDIATQVASLGDDYLNHRLFLVSVPDKTLEEALAVVVDLGPLPVRAKS